MSDARCLICADIARDHHEFSPPPPNCKCHPGDWHGAVEVPRVCRDFTPQKFDADRCNDCEHEKKCHATLTSQTTTTTGDPTDD